MKVSVNVSPKFAKSGALIMSKANVWMEIKDAPGHVVVPYSLMATKNEHGQWKSPFVVSGQPTYKDSNNNRKVSFQNLHMDGKLAEFLDNLVTLDWIKTETKRLKGKGEGIAADHELIDGVLVHEQDRGYLQSMDPEDADLMSDLVGMATEFAAKAQNSKVATPSQGTAENAKTVDQVLGQ